MPTLSRCRLTVLSPSSQISLKSCSIQAKNPIHGVNIRCRLIACKLAAMASSKLARVLFRWPLPLLLLPLLLPSEAQKMSLTFEDVSQVHHIAKLALFAMSARAVAASEFSGSPEVHEITVTISRSDDVDAPIDFALLGSGGLPLGGFSL